MSSPKKKIVARKFTVTKTTIDDLDRDIGTLLNDVAQIKEDIADIKSELREIRVELEKSGDD